MRTRLLGLGLAGVLAATGAAYGVSAATARDVVQLGAQKAPVVGTSCRVFPADNYWHADIRSLPVAKRSAGWLSHMSTGVDLHPDFGPSFGDGPNYGIPITVVGQSHPRVRVHFRYASESDRSRYPLGSDTRIEGGRSSTGDRHAIIIDKGVCRLYETFATQQRSGKWYAGSGAIWSLTSEQAPPRRLDVGRRGGTADPARSAAVERGQAPPRRPRHPVHHRRHVDTPPVAGPARCGLPDELELPTDGRPLPAEGDLPPVRVRRRGRWPW